MIFIRPVPVTGRSTSPYRCPPHTKQKSVLEHFVMVGDGTGPQFMHLLRNALHLTFQARCHHCPGCHFELITLLSPIDPFLLTSRNTKFFDLAHAIIATLSGHHACADAMPCMASQRLPWASLATAYNFPLVLPQRKNELNEPVSVLVVFRFLVTA
jgi:hypothetical protein